MVPCAAIRRSNWNFSLRVPDKAWRQKKRPYCFPRHAWLRLNCSDIQTEGRKRRDREEHTRLVFTSKFEEEKGDRRLFRIVCTLPYLWNTWVWGCSNSHTNIDTLRSYISGRIGKRLVGVVVFNLWVKAVEIMFINFVQIFSFWHWFLIIGQALTSLTSHNQSYKWLHI